VREVSLCSSSPTVVWRYWNTLVVWFGCWVWVERRLHFFAFFFFEWLWLRDVSEYVLAASENLAAPLTRSCGNLELPYVKTSCLLLNKLRTRMLDVIYIKTSAQLLLLKILWPWHCLANTLLFRVNDLMTSRSVTNTSRRVNQKARLPTSSAPIIT